MNIGKLITRAEYAHLLLAAGLKLENINFSSAEYWCPTRDWLVDFGQWIKWDRPKYTPDSFVCFHFARMAAAEADRSSLRAGNIVHHSFGEALGVFNNSSHELNLCLCDDGIIYTFDPQCAEDPSTIVSVDKSDFHPTKFRV